MNMNIKLNPMKIKLESQNKSNPPTSPKKYPKPSKQFAKQSVKNGLMRMLKSRMS